MINFQSFMVTERFMSLKLDRKILTVLARVRPLKSKFFRASLHLQTYTEIGASCSEVFYRSK